MGQQSLLDRQWDRQYIDGEWCSSNGDQIPVTDPATGDVIAKVPAATESDVDRAFSAATTAQQAWANTVPQDRVSVITDAIEVLEDLEEAVVELISTETGGAAEKAEREFGVSVKMMHEAASHAYRPEGDFKQGMHQGKGNIVRRNPVGTVGVITPWNFPLILGVRAVIPALSLGNAVVLKPDENSPITGGMLFAELFDQAGLPDGLLNVVPGRGSEAGAAIASHPNADVLSFTGSTPVGREVGKAAVDNLNQPTLELGGNNPYVVTENADLDRAINAGVFGSFHFSGQTCISINRHLVHTELYDDYVGELAKRAADITVGDPREESTDIGPIINESQRDRMMGFLEESVDRGAQIEVGGTYEDLFVEPTVLSDARNEMPIAQNEHFGPIAPVIPYDTDEEAISLANDTDYGLSGAVQSQDIDQAWKIANRIESGMVHINDHTNLDDPQIPFGGVKNSGLGRYNGQAIIEKFTEPKWISIQHGEYEYPL